MTPPATRVPLSTWLEALESEHGPLPPELRHACLTLARFMAGDGSAGCFPGTRTLAVRIGVHRATVSRWLHQLVQLGWLDRELRRRQFGRLGGHYFPALPMAHADAPIHAANGAPERANSLNGALEAGVNGASEGKIGARDREIGAPSVRLTLTESLTEKSAAAPLPANAGAAARHERMTDGTLREQARVMRMMRWSDERILKKYAKHGMTPAHLQPVADTGLPATAAATASEPEEKR
jgi:hypothetical protein